MISLSDKTHLPKPAATRLYGGQVHVNPRAKPYKSKSLAMLNWVTNFHVSQYPPCGQTSNLNTTDIKTLSVWILIAQRLFSWEALSNSALKNRPG